MVAVRSQLFKEARDQFQREMEERYHNSSKDLRTLNEFLTQNGSPEEARKEASALKTESGEKWGSHKLGDTDIKGAWIDKIMENIETFVKVGNYTMEGAPESVGLAWFAIKLTLSAIKSNYDLYALFGVSLTEISELMIIIVHYDMLYDQRQSHKTNRQLPESPVIERLFRHIVDAYVAVLSFSLSVKRHISPAFTARFMHGLGDLFGKNMAKFKSKMNRINEAKTKILQESQAIFQDKTMQSLDSIQTILSGIESAVHIIKDHQSILEALKKEQSQIWDTMLRKLADIETNTKPKTPWDFALHEFEKNKEVLKPYPVSQAWADAIDERHSGTCEWILDTEEFCNWKQSKGNSLLCLTGQQGSGKSIILATIIERLGLVGETNNRLLYITCKTKGGTVGKASLSADDVWHTLLYQLYDLARKDEGDLQLLLACNKMFANRKKSANANSMVKKDEGLPDFAETLASIAARLKVNLLVVVDETHSLPPKDQEVLAKKIHDLIPTRNSGTDTDLKIKALVGCRLGTEFHRHIMPEESKNCSNHSSINVGDHNRGDIGKKLSHELEFIPGLTADEKKEAMRVISAKATHHFAYVDIAIRFMCEPFQCPLAERLKSLPEGMTSIYDEELRKMGSNYVDLLRTALTWTLLGPVPLKVEEIMDAYRGTYSSRPHNMEGTKTMDKTSFDTASALDRQQLTDASGSFLWLEQEPSSRGYFVNLQDPDQISEFCLQSKPDDIKKPLDNGELCVNCNKAIKENKTLSISAKEAHLDIALACLRSLNNQEFQQKAMFEERTDPKPAANGSKAPDQPSGDDEIHMSKSSVSELAVLEGSSEEPGRDEEAADEKLGEVEMRSKTVQKPESRDKADDANEAGDVVEMNNEGKEETHGDDDDDNADGLDKAVDDDGYDSDGSHGDGDLVRTDVDTALQSNVEDDDDYDDDDDDVAFSVRKVRYELLCWDYHLSKAEREWKPEERKESKKWAQVMDELDILSNLEGNGNQEFFEWWQKIRIVIEGNPERQWKPLHVAAALSLTTWVEHLLLDKKNSVSETCRTEGHDSNVAQIAAFYGERFDTLKLLVEHGADLNAQPSPGKFPPAFHSSLYRDSSHENVSFLLDHGADPSLVDATNGWNSLHYLAWTGTDFETLHLLLDKDVDGRKVDINAVDVNHGATPVHFVLWRREVPRPLLQAFVDRGADMNKDDNESSRPPQAACFWGDLESLKIVWSAKKVITDVDDDDEDGDTAVHTAAMLGYAECLEFLLLHGAEPNKLDKFGRTALQRSAWKGSKECTEILLQYGAELKHCDKHGRTPLFYACRSNSDETAVMLLDVLLTQKIPMAKINAITKCKRSVLWRAANSGFDKVVDKMLKAAQAENDTDSLALNLQDTPKSMSPLQRAACLGHLECVRLLLDANADVTLLDKNGKTALVLAYEQWTLANDHASFEEIISLLIKASANSVVVQDPELVAICATNGSERLLQQLSALDADLTRADRYGWTPVELARKFGHPKVASFLERQFTWRWAPKPGTCVRKDGQGVSHETNKRVCISTERPLPAWVNSFYFEITLKKSPTEDKPVGPVWPIFAIGFCTLGSGGLQFPGWPPRTEAPRTRSWAYHGDDGGLYVSSGNGHPVLNELPYKPGMTVGCGVDLQKQTLWFTREGRRLEGGFQDVKGRLFPLLGLKDTVELETNFKGPFMWKAEAEPEGPAEK